MYYTINNVFCKGKLYIFADNCKKICIDYIKIISKHIYKKIHNIDKYINKIYYRRYKGDWKNGIN